MGINSNTPKRPSSFLRDYKKGEGSKRKEFFEIEKEYINRGESDTPIDPDGRVLEHLANMRNNANSIVMVVDKKYLHKIEEKSGYVKIDSKPLKNRVVSEVHPICPNTAYANQHSAFARGSGFFVKYFDEAESYVIATAAHVVVDARVKFEDLRFIYGIIASEENIYEDGIVVHECQVFRPVYEKLAPEQYALSSLSVDWALVEVKRAYENNFDCPIEAPTTVDLYDGQEMVTEATPIYSIGHGLALPMKVSYDGEVKRTRKQNDYFECDLTLVGGNSGSPVFHADTHQLVGIYIRGTQKWKLRDKACTTKTCDGRRCLIVKNEWNYEGQECQTLEVVKRALHTLCEKYEAVAV